MGTDQLYEDTCDHCGAQIFSNGDVDCEDPGGVVEHECDPEPEECSECGEEIYPDDFMEHECDV